MWTIYLFLAWRSIESESEVTAMGLFTVSKSTMLTAYSTILGYLIILVQFNQTANDSVESMIPISEGVIQGVPINMGI